MCFSGLITVLNNNDMIEETPVRNGIKSIELKPIKFDKVGMGILQNGDVNGVLDKPLLQRENSDLSEKSETSDTSQHVTMKKRVGLLSGVALIVGTMIGEFSLYFLAHQMKENSKFMEFFKKSTLFFFLGKFPSYFVLFVVEQCILWLSVEL